MRGGGYPPGERERKRVLDVLRSHPGLTGHQLAEHVGANAAWVLSELKRRSDAWTDDSGRWYTR
jgi:hypothetical protein